MEIITFLPTDAKLSLALTNKAMLDLIGQQPLRQIGKSLVQDIGLYFDISRNECVNRRVQDPHQNLARLAFLSNLQRDLPTQGFCSWCLTLHPKHLMDKFGTACCRLAFPGFYCGCMGQIRPGAILTNWKVFWRNRSIRFEAICFDNCTGAVPRWTRTLPNYRCHMSGSQTGPRLSYFGAPAFKDVSIQQQESDQGLTASPVYLIMVDQWKSYQEQLRGILLRFCSHLTFPIDESLARLVKCQFSHPGKRSCLGCADLPKNCPHCDTFFEVGSDLRRKKKSIHVVLFISIERNLGFGRGSFHRRRLAVLSLPGLSVGPFRRGVTGAQQALEASLERALR